MMVYLDPNNKWNIVIVNEKGKKNYISIPPTEGNRIDIIRYDKSIIGYNIDFKGIIIIINNGEPILINNIT